MAKIVLEDTNGGYNIASINRNFQKLQSELNNKVLYRLNDIPFESNAWLSSMDANGKRLYNLPAPTLPSEAARLQDVQQAISGLPSANFIPFSPYLDITSTNVQGAIQEVKDDVNTVLGNNGGNSVFFTQTGTGAVPVSVSSALKEFVTPRQFGAVGGGADDTLALQRALATGKDVFLSEVFTFQDVPLVLNTANQRLWGPGGLIQKSVSISNVPANTAAPYGASSYPAVLMNASGCSVEIKSIVAAWEGVQMAANNCSVVGVRVQASAVNWYDGVLVYANNAIVERCSVKDFGTWQPVPNTYRFRGAGIFLSSGSLGACFGTRVVNNYIGSCAHNALFIIGHRDFVISGNVMEACGMSAIQIAFLNGLPGGNAQSFSIANNIGRLCGADSIDINNGSGTPDEQLHGSITGNTFEENGFLYPTAAAQLSRAGTGSSTNDGSGITLIAVSDLVSTGNYFYKCGRAILFAANCARLHMDDAGTKTSSNILDDTDGIRLAQVLNSTIQTDVFVNGTAYRAEGDCSGTVVHNCRWQCVVAGSAAIVYPAGTSVPMLRDIYVRIESGTFFLNGIGPIYSSTFASSGSAVSLHGGNVLIVDSQFVGPEITVSIVDPITCTLRGVTLIGNNSVTSVLEIRNSLAGHFHDIMVSNAGNKPAMLFYGGNPSGTNYLRNVTAQNTGGGNSLRIESTIPTSVSFFIDEEVLTPGFADLAGGTKKYLTWT